MKAFTVIELIIVMSVISTISLLSMLTIVSFQNTTLLNNATRELASTLRTARAKSLAGEVDPLVTYDPNGLPEYSLKIVGATYYINSIYRVAGAPSLTEAKIDNTETKIDDKITLTYSGADNLLFERLTGKTLGETYTLTNTVGSEKITVDTNGLVTIDKLY